MTVGLTLWMALLSVMLLACGGGQASSDVAIPPESSGAYVHDPTASRSYNLDEYETLTGHPIETFHEAPMLRARVKAGALPPVSERLPDNPLVMVPWEEIGRYGGELRYTNFEINYDVYLRHLNEVYLLEQAPEPGAAIYKWMDGHVQPGVFEHWEQSPDATMFTFRIRKGLKWSDGRPVTTEDVRFCVEDVILNKEVTPVLPEWARWGGKPVEWEIRDPYTFRLTFARSYGLFIPQLIGWRWDRLLLPAHYLKRFHTRYTPLARLLPLMKRFGYEERDWGRFYLAIGGSGVGGAGAFVPTRLPSVSGYPTLDPWLHVYQPSPGDFVLERNPYYYKIDPEGHQLPYIDRLARTFVSDLQVENLKILSGETHLQFQYIRFSDFPLLKRNEAKGNYWVMPLPAWQDYMLIYPLNLSPKDPVLKRLIQDVRFRQALSFALNREEIKETLFLGFGRPAQLAPLPGSPWYKEQLASASSEYNLAKAHRLLDEMGLRWDAEHQFRMRPDGTALTLRIDYYDVTPSAGPGAELAGAYWEALGIRVLIQQMDGNRFWQLKDANEIQVTVWWANGAVPNDIYFIGGFLITPPWWQWRLTHGASGEEPPDWARAVHANRELLLSTPSEAERYRAGQEIFRLLAEHLWVIGTVADVRVPFVYSRKLGNISVAERRRHYSITVAEAAEQWFFRE